MATGTAEDGPFEEYRIRRKLADERRAYVRVLVFGYTLGFAEWIAFPYELYLLGRDAFLGQELRFIYDAAGNVTGVQRNGEWFTPWSIREKQLRESLP